MSSNDNMAAASGSIEARVNALEAERSILLNALDVAGVGVWSWDLQDTFTCDARASRLIGLPLMGTVSVADFLVQFKEAGHGRMLDALDRASREHEAFDEQFELDASSPEGQQVRLQGQVVAGGRVLSGTCSRIKAQEDDSILDLPSKERMEQVFSLSEGLYFEHDYDGYVKWVNSRCESLLGFTSEEVVGRIYMDYLHPEDLARARQLLGRVIAGTVDDSVEQPFESRCRCKNGDYIWLSWTWAVDARRQLICALARDVTEAKTQQEQLTATLAQAQESNAELQSFASVASHDLREPLRMISSYLRLLQERSPDALDARAQRYINYACEGADRMRSLIEDLLSYSRLDSSAQRFEPVALDEVLEGAIGNLAVAIKHTTAEVTVDINNSPVVNGDRSRLIRLFQNLLGNAIKFHHEGSTPRVSVGFTDGNLAGEPNHWVVTIQDNGIGIDPDHQELLFNVFQRLNTRDEFEGSGIGLAVCKKIAEQHEGRIWFASEVGKGSTFYVTIAKLQEASIRD